MQDAISMVLRPKTLYRVSSITFPVSGYDKMVKPVRRTNAKRFGPMNVDDICDCPGVYVILNRNLDPQYVGSSSTLRRRLREHLAKKDIPDSRYFRTYQAKNTAEARRLEGHLFRKHKPYYNIQEL